jgi:hypothetical protein
MKFVNLLLFMAVLAMNNCSHTDQQTSNSSSSVSSNAVTNVDSTKKLISLFLNAAYHDIPDQNRISFLSTPLTASQYEKHLERLPILYAMMCSKSAHQQRIDRLILFEEGALSSSGRWVEPKHLELFVARIPEHLLIMYLMCPPGRLRQLMFARAQATPLAIFRYLSAFKYTNGPYLSTLLFEMKGMFRAISFRDLSELVRIFRLSFNHPNNGLIPPILRIMPAIMFAYCSAEQLRLFPDEFGWCAAHYPIFGTATVIYKKLTLPGSHYPGSLWFTDPLNQALVRSGCPLVLWADGSPSTMYTHGQMAESLLRHMVKPSLMSDAEFGLMRQIVCKCGASDSADILFPSTAAATGRKRKRGDEGDDGDAVVQQTLDFLIDDVKGLVMSQLNSDFRLVCRAAAQSPHPPSSPTNLHTFLTMLVDDPQEIEKLGWALLDVYRHITPPDKYLIDVFFRNVREVSE